MYLDFEDMFADLTSKSIQAARVAAIAGIQTAEAARVAANAGVRTAEATRVAAIAGVQTAEQLQRLRGQLANDFGQLHGVLNDISEQNRDIANLHLAGIALQQEMIRREDFQNKLEELIYQFQRLVKKVNDPQCDYPTPTRYHLLGGMLKKVADNSISSVVIKGRDNKEAFDSCVERASAVYKQLENHPEVKKALAWAAEHERKRLVDAAEQERRGSDRSSAENLGKIQTTRKTGSGGNQSKIPGNYQRFRSRSHGPVIVSHSPGNGNARFRWGHGAIDCENSGNPSYFRGSGICGRAVRPERRRLADEQQRIAEETKRNAEEERIRAEFRKAEEREMKINGLKLAIFEMEQSKVEPTFDAWFATQFRPWSTVIANKKMRFWFWFLAVGFYCVPLALMGVLYIVYLSRREAFAEHLNAPRNHDIQELKHKLAKLPLPDVPIPKTIQFTCPGCSKHLHASNDQVGAYVTCPDCQAYFPVPYPQRTIQFRCPSCNMTLQSASGQAGTTVTCPGCQTLMQIPLQK